MFQKHSPHATVDPKGGFAPVRTMFAIIEDLADEVEILILFVSLGRDRGLVRPIGSFTILSF
jgi:hypothetical protein